MVFNAVLNSISVISSGQCTYPCFPGFFLSVLRAMFFPNHWLLSHVTIVETTYSNERRMNPVAMTIINPLRAYRPSRGLNQRLPVLKSATLPTKLWGSAKCPEIRCQPPHGEQPLNKLEEHLILKCIKSRKIFKMLKITRTITTLWLTNLK